MKNYKSWAIIFICLFLLMTIFCFSVYGDDTSVDFKAVVNESDLVIKLKEASGLTMSVSSDFTQIKRLSLLSDEIKSSGIFLFKRDKKVRWEYLKPFNYLIVINNDNIDIKDGDKITKFKSGSNRVFSEMNRLILGSLNGDIFDRDKNPDFKIEYLENSEQYLVRLTPLNKGMKDFMEGINLYIDKTDYSVSAIKILEESGDFTKMVFLNRKKNTEIPDEQFIIE